MTQENILTEAAVNFESEYDIFLNTNRLFSEHSDPHHSFAKVWAHNILSMQTKESIRIEKASEKSLNGGMHISISSWKKAVKNIMIGYTPSIIFSRGSGAVAVFRDRSALALVAVDNDHIPCLSNFCTHDYPSHMDREYLSVYGIESHNTQCGWVIDPYRILMVAAVTSIDGVIHEIHFGSAMGNSQAVARIRKNKSNGFESQDYEYQEFVLSDPDKEYKKKSIDKDDGKDGFSFGERIKTEKGVAFRKKIDVFSGMIGRARCRNIPALLPVSELNIENGGSLTYARRNETWNRRDVRWPAWGPIENFYKKQRGRIQ